MKDETAHNILRSSILFEMHGEMLYQQVADQADDQNVKQFFQQMADDEKLHAEVLRQQFDYYQKNTKFDSTTNTRYVTNRVEQIRNPQLVELIKTSSFEAAAITAAILMEEKSVIEYSQMAEQSNDPEEVKLYQWLSEWEQEHVERLTELRDALTTKSLITERI